MAYPNPLRDVTGRKARLSAEDERTVHRAWDRFCEIRDQFNPYIKGYCTRSRYDAAEEAGQKIVAFQEQMGVWLIHPANAGPGLKPDDSRIIEDVSPGFIPNIGALVPTQLSLIA